MCKIMDEICDIAAREARQEYSIQIARTMREAGRLSNDDIAAYTGLTLDEVKAIDTRQPA